MNILGSIPHDRIGAIAQTIVKALICHHSKILCFVNDHMAGFPDWIHLLDPFV